MQLSTVRPGHLVGALGILGFGAVLLFWAPWSAQARADQSQRASNVLVNCEPSQQTLVRQTIVNNELNVAIQCVTSAQAQTVGYVDQFGRPLLPVGGVARPIPAVYAPPPTLVSTPAAPRTRVVSRSSESRRSWQKRALVLGGSAGAGAGIGGLIGGKKGALIGAALGGGGAALYEATKDR